MAVPTKRPPTRIQRRTKVLPRIGPGSAGIIMTPTEFDAIDNYDERFRYQLIRGVLVVTPIAAAGETDPNEELGSLLRIYRRENPRGGCLDKTLPQQYLRVGKKRRLADRLIWCGLGRVPNLKLDLPTIVVEFVSAARRDWERDYLIERSEYSKLKIPEYWIIDRFRRIMTVIITEGRKQREVRVTEDETYRTPRLPGFELPLKRLLAAADDWKKAK